LIPINKRQLRSLALKDLKGFRKYLTGARVRDLIALHLLPHPEEIAKASPGRNPAAADAVIPKGGHLLNQPDSAGGF